MPITFAAGQMSRAIRAAIMSDGVRRVARSSSAISLQIERTSQMLPTHQRPPPIVTTERRLNLSLPIKDKSQPETSLASDAAPDDGSHLADYVVPDLDVEADDSDAPVHVDDIEAAEQVELEAAPDNLIGQDAFFTVFKAAFSIPQFAQPDMAVLAVQPDEEPAARAASDATYSLLKIYYPAALKPQGEVIAYLMIAGPFFMAKAMIVREVLRARRARPVSPQHEPQAAPQEAANDNWPVDIEAVNLNQPDPAE